MKLTLVRHGQTEENAAGIIQGQLPGHLTEKGKEQARAVAEQLKDEDFDAIYCSDLQRCLDTAEPIRAFHPDVPFITETLLRERKGGDLEGHPAVGEYADYTRPDWYTHRLPGGGESWEDVRTRQSSLLNNMFERYPEGSVLLITHGGPLHGIRSLLEGRTLADIDTEETPNAGVWYEEMTELLHG